MIKYDAHAAAYSRSRPLLAQIARATMSDAEAQAALALTRRVADDPGDPRRFMAAGDLGSALAVGAHGAEKLGTDALECLFFGALFRASSWLYSRVTLVFPCPDSFFFPPPARRRL